MLLGDVVTVGDKKYVIYEDEVRSGGTVAWVCRNPGAIRDGDKYGAYAGKKFHTKAAGAFAIFPDENTGRMAIIKVLRVFGRVTLRQALRKYAPASDGSNNPDKYAEIVAREMKLSPDVLLPTLSDEQLCRMTFAISGVEGMKQGGDPQPRDSAKLPQEVRARL